MLKEAKLTWKVNYIQLYTHDVELTNRNYKWNFEGSLFHFYWKRQCLFGG